MGKIVSLYRRYLAEMRWLEFKSVRENTEFLECLIRSIPGKNEQYRGKVREYERLCTDKSHKFETNSSKRRSGDFATPTGCGDKDFLLVLLGRMSK